MKGYRLKVKYMLLAMLLCMAVSGHAQSGVRLRAGYVIGGTSPLPLPREIRSINSFRPKGGLTVGFDAYRQFSRRWGFQLGWHLFYEGFHTSADVKNYRMAITQDENHLEGNFTGTDETDTWMLGTTIPLTATYRLSPYWTLCAGPFVSVLYDYSFKGHVYDGYLREGNPTGQKVVITRDNPATYNFRHDMLNAYWGVQLLADWQPTRHIGFFADVDWGLSSIFPASFPTVQFKMYPIYAKMGITYKL